MKLVIGLGNPGEEYSQTRHNVGFRVLAELAKRWDLSPVDKKSVKKKFQAETIETVFDSEKTILVAPQTYMNESGRSVGQFVDYFHVPHENLIVVSDDMNLPLGKIRLRAGGSAGGQKGIASIIQRLGTEEFPRLRIGIGRPPGKMSATSFVLTKFRASEKEEIEDTILRSADSVESWIRDGIEIAMNRTNGSISQDD